MKKHAKSSRNRGSALRSILAILLMLSGIALLARAGSSGAPAQAPQAAATTPGLPRFQNYPAPAGIAEDVGEPSIGSNWKSEKKFSNSMFEIPNGGATLLYGGLELGGTPMERITFNDCPSPAVALWEVKRPTLNQTPRAAGDPILFTDHDTGRTFISQLEGLTPAGSSTDITDDDGETFFPSEGSSLPSDIDHQTFGGGRYHDPAPPNLTGYANAVYYASQSVSDARATRSDDGGVTFGPAFPMYTINQCEGLHGHIKVSPKDGTVYVPNAACGGALPFHDVDAKQAVIVSEDNGITWNIRTIPDSTTHGNGNEQNTRLQTRDPSVAIDADGTVYFVYQAEDRLTEVMDPADKAGDTHPKVAVSHDKGVTWGPSIDVGANVINGNPIRNATFVAATAGSSGRAAVAFFGTETGGNNWACGSGDDCSGDTGLFPRDPFAGVWYLYISTTFDGGKTWITQNVTPGDPIQRGGICGGGTCRNLLDFMDLQIDKEGRILVAGEDGCIGPCVQGGGNSFSAKGFVTRQSGGKRMLAAFDSAEPALAGAPNVTATIDAAKTQVSLTWPPPDNGGSDITGYNVYRIAGAGSPVLIGTVTQTSFNDTSFDPNATNKYRVTAVNAVGEGPYCAEAVPVVIPAPDPCKLPGITILTDPAGDLITPIGVTTYPGYDLRSLSVAEPFNLADKLVFTIKVESLMTVPPDARWPVQFRLASDPANLGRWVDMSTDAAGMVTFNYGTFVVTNGAYGNPNTTVGQADAESKYNADGTITIVLSRSKTGNPAPGGIMQGFLIRVRIGNTITPDNMPSSLTPDGTYVIKGNAFCAPNTPPIAQLVATPDHGNPPLTVAFDGSTSVDPDPSDSIASYTFSFGDGSPDVTQANPTISHTYKHGGDFFATLTVKDSKGLNSANIASVPIKVSAQLLNLSTRLRVQPGDNALIGGFIIRGSEQKKIILRGIGPSLNVPGKLADPVIQLFNSNGVNIAGNDDWKTDQQNVEATGLAPSNDRESAIVITLDPGLYTLVMRGKNNSSGIGVVEAYDIGLAANARLANVSSRGFIGTGDNVLIGGFFAGPQTASFTGVVLRAIGPSLTQFGVPQAMPDPVLELHNGNGDIIATNDDWQSDQKSQIQATGLAPSDPRESAILFQHFEPGPYTAIVRGKNNAVGVGLVEIYDVQQ
ncbi:MAG TPA: PKD domain-containing protein [Chthoniobacterales bacterium]|nr:PKD domain-containing protein [Chthoniobacterales bacterium]